MATPIFTLSPEMQHSWDDIMGQMVAFVNDTNADIDMAYDWVCEMLDISSFVDNEAAWNSFYDTWETCENRNDLNTFQIVWVINIIMQETKYLLHGQFHRANGWIMNDCLGYIKATEQEAIDTCKRLNPNFVIHSITIENWWPLLTLTSKILSKWDMIEKTAKSRLKCSLRKSFRIQFTVAHFRLKKNIMKRFMSSWMACKSSSVHCY